MVVGLGDGVAVLLLVVAEVARRQKVVELYASLNGPGGAIAQPVDLCSVDGGPRVMLVIPDPYVASSVDMASGGVKLVVVVGLRDVVSVLLIDVAAAIVAISDNRETAMAATWVSSRSCLVRGWPRS